MTEAPAVARTGEMATLIRQLRHDPASRGSGIIIVLFIALALLAPVIGSIFGQDPYTYHLDQLDPGGVPAGFGGGISSAHWFGVEPLTGRDVFALVLFGSRTSLFVGLAGTLVSVFVGTIVGMVAGYVGGWTDRVLSRAIDVIFGFPFLIFMIALGAILPPTVNKTAVLVIVIGLFGWPTIARVVRGQTMILAQRPFVTASLIAGGSRSHIMIRQILPNLVPTVVVMGTISIPSKIGAEAALSFLGVGTPPPTPSWGRTIGDAVSWFTVDPMYLIFPGLALVILTLAFNLFGDSLTEALDPRIGRYGR